MGFYWMYKESAYSYLAMEGGWGGVGGESKICLKNERPKWCAAAKNGHDGQTAYRDCTVMDVTEVCCKKISKISLHQYSEGKWLFVQIQVPLASRKVSQPKKCTKGDRLRNAFIDCNLVSFCSDSLQTHD